MITSVVSIIVAGCLGLIVGSFLNVVILRMRTGRSFVQGRSQCMSCNHTLAWYDLVPLLSFVTLGGRCRYCHARLSFQYVWVEAVTALWFMLMIGFRGLSLGTVFGIGIGVVALLIAVYDIRHKIIPDVFSYILIGMGVGMTIYYFVLGSNSMLSAPFLSLHNPLLGIVIAVPFFLLWVLSQGKWFGLGDVKYMVGIGLILGLLHGIEVVMSSFWIALLIIAMFAIGERISQWLSPAKWGKGEKSLVTFGKEIPFGPFLSLACMLELLGIHVFQLFFN